MNFREMSLSDLENIKDTLETEFDDFWNYTVFKSELENINSKYFVLEENNEIIGFIGCLIILDNSEITNIVINKSYRGNGYSKILLSNLINFLKNLNIKKLQLEVSSSNFTAINLYKSFGFVQVGLRPSYYKNSDALLMDLGL